MSEPRTPRQRAQWHRSHGHYLAKGGDLKAMIAEIYGRVAGSSGGGGGSMDLVDFDFAVLTIEIVNQAAKWHYMCGGCMCVPLVVRTIIGRGWGQGPQHSQSLWASFARVPGLRVVMQTTPWDAKGFLNASIAEDKPVIFIEHRWLYGVTAHVPEGAYRVPLGRARMARLGTTSRRSEYRI